MFLQQHEASVRMYRYLFQVNFDIHIYTRINACHFACVGLCLRVHVPPPYPFECLHFVDVFVFAWILTIVACVFWHISLSFPFEWLKVNICICIFTLFLYIFAMYECVCACTAIYSSWTPTCILYARKYKLLCFGVWMFECVHVQLPCAQIHVYVSVSVSVRLLPPSSGDCKHIYTDVCECIYIYMHIYIYTFTYIYMYTYIYTCKYELLFYVCVYMYSQFSWVNVYVYVSLRVRSMTR